jgi:uncharacterized membrane protein
MQSFTIKEAFAFAWSAYKEHIAFLVPLFLVLGAIYALVGWGSQPQNGDWIVQVIGSVIEIYLSMGIIHIALKIYRKEAIAVRDMFLGWEYFWKTIISAILVGLTVLAGFILLIVPGIVWWVTYMFYSYFVVDKKAGPVEAMKLSRKITVGERWHILGFALVTILANLAGLILLGIGLLVSIPVTALAIVYVYQKLSEKKLGNSSSAEVSTPVS